MEIQNYLIVIEIINMLKHLTLFKTQLKLQWERVLFQLIQKVLNSIGQVVHYHNINTVH